MAHYRQLLLIVGLVFLNLITSATFAQTAGDYKSKTSGQWGNYSTWQVYNGTTWNDATSGQFPGGTSEANSKSVYIEAGHTVTLEADHSCKDLHLNTTSDVIRLNTQNNTLDVWGKMRFFQGAAPGTATTPYPITSSGILGWITTGSNGYIRFKGTANRIVMAQGQVNSNNNNSGWNLDFAFDPGFTGQINDRIRASNITVSSGTLLVNNPTGELRVGTNNGASDLTPNGSFLIKSGATVKGGAGIFKKSNVAAGSIVAESGSNLIIDQTGFVLAASTLTLDGTVTLKNVINFPTESGRANSVPVNTFNNLILDSIGAKSLQNNITVNGTLRLKATASLASGSFALSYGNSGTLEYNGSTAQTTTSSEFPSSSGPTNLIINNSNNVTLHSARTINNQLALTSGLFLLGDNDLTLGAGSPAISGTPSSSNMVVTNGTGKLIKIFSSAGSFLYPVGETTGTTEYSSAQINVNSANTFDGSTYFGIRVVDNDHPAATSTSDDISRYWEVNTNMTGFSYNGTFQYQASDVNGSEANVNAFIFTNETASASRIAINPVNINTHQINFSNVSNSGFVSGANFGCSISNNSITNPATTTFCNSASSILFNGSAATVSSASPSYQWQQRISQGTWANVSSNGQSEDYLETGPLSAGTYEYRRIVSDPSFCISFDTSNVVSITIIPLISGNSIGSNQTVPTGGNPAIFTETNAISGGDGIYAYQWQSATTQGGPYSDISGASSSTYDAPSGISQATYFVRQVSSGTCSSTSNELTVTICDPPVITTQALNKTICAGLNTSFDIAASGTNTLTYQWQESTDGGTTFANISNGAVYSNANTASLSISGATVSMNNYQYKCIVTGSCSPSATSNIVKLTVNSPASVVSNPDDLTTCSGSNISFSATGTGTGVGYRWQFSNNGGASFTNLTNTSPYSTVATPTLNISSVPANFNNFQFRCAIIGSCSTVYTNPALLTITSPIITTQAVNKTICAGLSTTFDITASGIALTYQWQESTDGGTTFANISNGGVYSNVNTSSLSISGATVSMNNYHYKCILTGSCPPQLVSNAVKLTVNSPASVVSSPNDLTTCSGSNISFSATATGTGVGYRWQFSNNGGASFTNLTNTAPYNNVATPTLSISSVPSNFNNFQFRCAITGSCSMVYTNPALLTITSPIITSQAVNRTICAGLSTTFDVTTSGTGLTYQWQESTNGGSSFTNIVNGGSYSNATTSSLSIAGATVSMNNYKYRCVVTGTCSIVIMSNTVTLTVNSPAAVVSSPSDFTACLGTNVSFSVSGTGTGIGYRWQFSSNGGITFVNLTNTGSYSAVATSTLHITAVPSTYNNFKYRCAIIGSCSTVYSDPAILTVNTGCTSKSGSFEEESLEAAEIQAFPNPFTNEFNLHLKGFGNDATITIKDIEGKIILTREHYSSDQIIIGENLPLGMYILEVKNDNSMKAIKILKTN